MSTDGEAPPPTRLVPHREKDPHDEKVLGVIAGMPHGAREGAPVMAGICNPAGDIYRKVHLVGGVEFILFAARMNAAGFAHETGVHAGKPSFHAIFRKVGRHQPESHR